jgi:hypothetical protein
LALQTLVVSALVDPFNGHWNYYRKLVPAALGLANGVGGDSSFGVDGVLFGGLSKVDGWGDREG